MNKRNIDFTPKKTLPAALVKVMPEIIILPQERDDGRYLYIRDICQILGSRNTKEHCNHTDLPKAYPLAIEQLLQLP